MQGCLLETLCHCRSGPSLPGIGTFMALTLLMFWVILLFWIILLLVDPATNHIWYRLEWEKVCTCSEPLQMTLSCCAISLALSLCFTFCCMPDIVSFCRTWACTLPSPTLCCGSQLDCNMSPDQKSMPRHLCIALTGSPAYRSKQEKDIPQRESSCLQAHIDNDMSALSISALTDSSAACAAGGT